MLKIIVAVMLGVAVLLPTAAAFAQDQATNGAVSAPVITPVSDAREGSNQ